MIYKNKNSIKLNDKVAIVTGASEGLGSQISKTLCKAGANIVLGARNKKKLEDLSDELNNLKTSDQKILYKKLDVTKDADVSSFVNLTIKEFGKCEILINNAGIYGPKGKFEDIELKDFSYAINVNFYGSIRMCHKLLPYMKRQKYGKIIQLSGGGATKPMPFITSYASSKSAIVRFMESLSHEVSGDNIFINSVAPGALNTKMLDEIIDSDANKVGKDYFEKAKKQKLSGGNSIEKACELILFLSSSYSDGISGKLISAVWDNWVDWKQNLKELNEKDIYTLRRITGSDRNITWGDK